MSFKVSKHHDIPFSMPGQIMQKGLWKNKSTVRQRVPQSAVDLEFCILLKYEENIGSRIIEDVNLFKLQKKSHHIKSSLLLLVE